MASVTWTLQALDDLEAVCLYIARDAPRIAEMFAVRAFEVTDQLVEFPLSGRIVPEVSREDIREIFLHSYRIIYRFKSNEVEILTIHHGARLLPALS